MGPNTGGMGAYSPAPVLTPDIEARVMREIVEPTLAGMRARGTPFVGVLYAGLMLTPGGPKLIEYNVRFGDPECQVLMPRLESDILAAMRDASDGALDTLSLRWSHETALTVVLAARGYPGVVEKGSEIRGIDAAEAIPGARVFHAGTREEHGRLTANGGRVLNVTALGSTVAEAQERAYAAVHRIDWPEGFCRRDIGWRAVARESR
jgi:phosphoribosylamine--glycine ligase